MWLVMGCLTGVATAQETDPLRPEVRKAVDRACEYLKQQGMQLAVQTPRASMRLGLTSLTLLALQKADAVGPNDPIVQEALGHIRQDIYDQELPNSYEAPYACALALLTLVELDPKAHAQEIRQLRSLMQSFQMPHGGVSCLRLKVKQRAGDTSMTQYGALAFWALDQTPQGVSSKSWQNLANWLLNAQHQSGGYPYEPHALGGGPRLGTTAAALSAIYICLARAKLGQRARAKQEDQNDGLPPALERVRPEGQKQIKLSPLSLPTGRLEQAAQRAEQWLQGKFSFREAEHKYVFYFLYSVERYHSFQELVHPDRQTSQKWYEQGVQYLLQRQRSNGSWGIGGTSTRIEVSRAPAPTAFAVLFLVRATRKMLQKVQPASGTLIGGRGLPPGGGPLELRGGQVRVKPLRGPADQLLGIMKDPNDPRFLQALSALEEMTQDPDPQMLSKLDRQLRELAQHGSPAAKAAAVRALGASGKMDVVPLLIRLLEDPEPQVMIAARDALRRISRRMEGFGLPDQPTNQQRQEAIRKWKRWYEMVHPQDTSSQNRTSG